MLRKIVASQDAVGDFDLPIDPEEYAAGRDAYRADLDARGD